MEVMEEPSEDDGLEDDVMLVSKDRDEDEIVELENVGSKLLELEITGNYVSYNTPISLHLLNLQVVELELTMREAKLVGIERVDVGTDTAL